MVRAGAARKGVDACVKSFLVGSKRARGAASCALERVFLESALPVVCFWP